MKRLGIGVVAAVCLGVCLVAGGALAAPGDPFGGDDTGCVPDTIDHRQCSQVIVEAFGRLINSVSSCHIKQASAVFKGSSVDEESCEMKAKAHFDGTVASISSKCSPQVLAGANAFAAVLLAPATSSPQSLDAQNGNVYCDGTVAIDGTGEDAGKIPLSKDGLKCANAVSKNLARLAGVATGGGTRGVLKCHWKAANAAFRKQHFDEEACEMVALATFNKGRDKVLSICPACLDQAAQDNLASGPTIGVTTQLDNNFNSIVYPCPATTTTTTAVSTTTTTT